MTDDEIRGVAQAAWDGAYGSDDPVGVISDALAAMVAGARAVGRTEMAEQVRDLLPAAALRSPSPGGAALRELLGKRQRCEGCTDLRCTDCDESTGRRERPGGR